MTEESLFHKALAITDPEARVAYLKQHCAEQPELQAEVLALLKAHEESDGLLGFPIQATPEDCSSLEGSNRGSHPSTDLEFSAHTPDLPPQIGRYSILQLLGRGGMGAVYLAHDPELNRSVALKVPRLAGLHAEERFLREARAAAAITHPNVCPVFEVGREKGTPYLTMAYIAGPTLREILKRNGPMPPVKAAQVAHRIAMAMAEAHRHGIVHRDLKPGNILIDERGEPIVTDFGLALLGLLPDLPGSVPPKSDETSRITHQGMIVGTPGYMAPEQAEGALERMGPASDIYSLGAIFFALLTGQAPFQAATIRELKEKILNEPAPLPSKYRPGLSARYDAVCVRALAKEPSLRYPSMAAMAEALVPLTVKKRSVTPWILGGVGLALLLLGGILSYQATNQGTLAIRLPDPEVQAEIRVDGSLVENLDHGQVATLTVGPHELEVKARGFEPVSKVFSLARGEFKVVEIELKPLDRPSNPQNPDRNRPSNPQNPDRKRLAYLLQSGRRLIDMKEFEELESLAQEALKIDPESPGALAMRATYRTVVQFDVVGGRADVEAALKQNPETFQALFTRGFLNRVEKRYDESIADFTMALRLRPGDPHSWAQRAIAFGEMRAFHQVLSDATASLKCGPTWEAYANRGAGYACLGDYPKALADYDEAAKIAWKESRIFNQRSVLHAKMGHKEQSEADWRMAQSLDPTLRASHRPVLPDPQQPIPRKKLSKQEQEVLERTCETAQRALEQRNVPEARRAAEEAVRLDPTSARAHSLSARILASSQQLDEAEAEARVTLRLDPTDVWALLVRAIRREAQGDALGVIPYATMAITQDPRNAQAWYLRGNAYYGRGQYHQALCDLNEAIHLQSDLGRAYASRAGCHVRLGDAEKALIDYTRAADLMPKEPQWRYLCAALLDQLGRVEEARQQRALGLAQAPLDKPSTEVELPVPLPQSKKDPE